MHRYKKGPWWNTRAGDYLNADNELVHDILISVLASLANQWLRRISERTTDQS